MARGDLLVNLVKAGSNGDSGTFRKTVDAIVADERGKQHNVLADQIERAARAPNGNGLATIAKPSPEPGHRGRDLIFEIIPRRKLDELVLPDTTRLAAEQLIEEQQRANLLRSHSLEPRHRLLLVGPPGNGKTTLAEAIAEGLATQLFVVRYEGMIGSFLGETAARLKRVFEYARTTPCVLFFDEFDAVGKERGDKHETGEIKRVVTSLLMQIDDLPSYVVVIAATNHSELLDRAVWRRFQFRLSLPAPTPKQLIEFVQRTAERSALKIGVSAAQIVKTLGRVSYAEAEEFMMTIMRREILAAGQRPSDEIVREQLKIWSTRARSAKDGPGGEDEGAGSSAT
jgi:SpoVK/Ycf46/Vps4 family AAA+-type ATPase